MGSSNSDSIAIVAKNRVRKQRSIIDEAVSELAQKRVRKRQDEAVSAPHNIETVMSVVDALIMFNQVAFGRSEYIVVVSYIILPLVLFAPQNIKMMILRAGIE